jgi:hypothetical protein
LTVRASRPCDAGAGFFFASGVFGSRFFESRFSSIVDLNIQPVRYPSGLVASNFPGVVTPLQQQKRPRKPGPF